MTVVMLQSRHLLISSSSGILFSVPWCFFLERRMRAACPAYHDVHVLGTSLGHSNLFSALGVIFLSTSMCSVPWHLIPFFGLRCHCFRDGSLQISSIQRYIMKKLDLANENEVIYSDVGTLPFFFFDNDTSIFVLNQNKKKWAGHLLTCFRVPDLT